MSAIRLNEHDANQGAQSSGEFLGMSGNSGWYLLGSAGATILMVIVLWGVFGVSLLLCLLVGIVLCALSIAYVLVLKNNRPEHYDTDFFESALVEAGVIAFAFGPRAKPAINPFVKATDIAPFPSRPVVAPARTAVRHSTSSRVFRTPAFVSRSPEPAISPESSEKASESRRKDETAPSFTTDGDYEVLQEQLAATEELLEEAYAEGGRRDL